MATPHGFVPLPLASPEVVLCAAFSQYGTRLATGSGDHKLRVYDLDERNGTWELVESWRGHNGMILDIGLSPSPLLPLLGSSSLDLKLKLWAESHTAAPLSGRRFRHLLSISSPNPSPYVSLAFHAPSPPSTELFLAATDRDGLLALYEPDDPTCGDAWSQLDAFWVMGAAAPRGAESCFVVRFQDGGEGPGWGARAAGLDADALSVVVSAGTEAKVFRVLRGAGGGGAVAGAEGYRFQQPAAVLDRARGLVRDVAWAESGGRAKDLIATASADSMVRIYEVWTVTEKGVLVHGGGRGEGTGSHKGEDGKRARANSSQLALRQVHSGIGAGLAGAKKEGEEGLEPGQVLHGWECVAQLRHEGVWKVEWIRNGAMLVSTGDNGRAIVWARAQDGNWMDFANFGPDTSTEDGR